MGGIKHDKEKLRMDLIPYEAMEGLAEVLSFGANKYSDHNWRGGVAHSRLYAACQRHLSSYWNGETLDPESGLNHLKHALVNITFMLSLPEEDDRYAKNDSVRHRDDSNTIDRDNEHRKDTLPCSQMYRDGKDNHCFLLKGDECHYTTPEFCEHFKRAQHNRF